MYWIYLLLFVAMVIVPHLVHEGWTPILFGSVHFTEMIVLFGLSLGGLILFFIRDTQLRKFLHDCSKCRREIFQVTRDLSSSYNYIGEVNRKVEILKEVVSIFPKSTNGQTEKIDDVRSSIVKALHILGESKEFSFGIYNKNDDIFLESSGNIINTSYQDLKYFLGDCSRRSAAMDGYMYIRTDYDLESICAFVVYKKSSLHPENIEIIRSVLSKLLFIFLYSKR